MSVENAAFAGEAVAAPRLSWKWIADPWTDLLWLIGGAFTGYALFLAPPLLGWNLVTVWLVWYVLLDIPHFFGTYVRTYLDKQELRRRPVLLLGSLGWLAVGPSLLFIGHAMSQSGSETLRRHAMFPFEVMLPAFISLWAYWHVVRQHYGIMSLYKRKNHDSAPTDLWIDRSLLYVGLLAPFVALILCHQEARDVFGLPAGGPLPGAWDDVVVKLTIAALSIAVLIFVARQAQRGNRGEPINLPKVLFFLAVVPLHVYLAYHPRILATSLLTFGACVTIYHDVQYHAIVWHTQRTRFRDPEANFARHGLAALVGKHFMIYFVCAVLMGVGTWIVSCVMGIQASGCFGMGLSWDMPLFGAITLQHLIAGIAVGFIMHHYFIDQFIWRPSKDATLSQQLQLTQGGA